MSRTYRKKKYTRKSYSVFESDYVNYHFSHKGRRAFAAHWWDDVYLRYVGETEQQEKKRIKKERARFYRDGGKVHGVSFVLKWNEKKRVRAHDRNFCAKAKHFCFDAIPEYCEAETRSLVWQAF